MIWYLVIYWSLATATLDPSISSPILVNVCPEHYQFFATTEAAKFNERWAGLSEREKATALIFKGPEYTVEKTLILKKKTTVEPKVGFPW